MYILYCVHEQVQIISRCVTAYQWVMVQGGRYGDPTLWQWVDS